MKIGFLCSGVAVPKPHPLQISRKDTTQNMPLHRAAVPVQGARTGMATCLSLM